MEKKVLAYRFRRLLNGRKVSPEQMWGTPDAIARPADGETKPCMWYAVAFEFAADADITLLSCKATFSEPTNDVVGTRKHVFRAPALNPTYPCALGRL